MCVCVSECVYVLCVCVYLSLGVLLYNKMCMFVCVCAFVIEFMCSYNESKFEFLRVLVFVRVCACLCV